MQRFFALRQILHEVHEPAVGLEELLGVVTLVGQHDLGALVEERELLQPVRQDLLFELPGLGEDLGIRPEPDGRPRLGGGLPLGELLGDLPACE
jgi:hypothetical protein